MASVLASPRPTPAGERLTPIDADGTLHVPDFVIPPSDLVSPQFNKAYVKHATGTLAMSKLKQAGLPALSAPKAEWEDFDAKYDHSLAAPIAWDLEHYPVTVVDTRMAGIHVGIISPVGGVEPQNQHRVLINLHGGGFVVGRGLSAGELESIPIASIGKIKVITIDYRQAPYYKYPAASEDVEAVYRGLLNQYEPRAIGIFGGSAGGLLTSQVVAWFQAHNLPPPGAVGIFWAAPPSSPLLFGQRGDSTMWGLTGVPGASTQRMTAAMLAAAGWYLDSANINDPSAFPSSSDDVLSKFPPTLFLSGTRSFDLSPAVVAHARFLKLGVDSSLYVMEGGWHGAYLSTGGSPEEHDVNVYIAQWFKRHLAR
jgi:acetyl esterase/lipase